VLNRKISFLFILMLLGSVAASATPAAEELNDYFLPKGPNEVISPNGKQVAFLRLSEKKYQYSTDGDYPKDGMVRWPQLWIKDAAGKNEKMLSDVGGTAYDKKMESVSVYDVQGLGFSLDGKWLFFTRTLGAAGSFGNAKLYSVPADGSAPEKFLDAVSSMEIIKNGKYRGNLLVAQISNSFFKDKSSMATRPNAVPGPYFIYGVMDSEGKVIKTLHETSGMDALGKEAYAALKKEVEVMK